MSAVQDAIRERQRGLRRLMRWPWAWPLLAMPLSLIAYVLTVLAVDLALIGWELAETRWLSADLTLAAGLFVAAVVCIEAIRRLGQPSGVSRDLLSAWWLPIALLLPPVYALLAPCVIGLVLYLRARRIPLYRRVFSSAAERCVATVRPYATEAAMSVQADQAFTIGFSPVSETRRRTDDILAGALPAVICGHRENLPLILEEACAVLGAKPPDGHPLPPGGFWVLHIGWNALACAERHQATVR